jgi:hypothetical protein
MVCNTLYNTATMPTVAERTYTFRAAADLGARIQEASAVLAEIDDSASSDVAEKIAAELALALARDSTRFHGVRGNQSAFMRETIELLVGAARKVASDLRYADLYAEAATSRSKDEVELHQAGRTRAAKRWRAA